MKRLAAITVASVVALALAGCGAPLSRVPPTAAPRLTDQRTFDADSLVAILTSVKSTLGSGTIIDDATFKQRAQTAGSSNALGALTALGATIDPASCSAALGKASTFANSPLLKTPGAVGAGLTYTGGTIGLLTVAGKPLPPTIYSNAVSAASQVLTLCHNLTLTIKGQSVPISITKVPVLTNADTAVAITEKMSAAGQTITITIASAVYGNILITDEQLGGTAQAVAGIDSVVAAIKSDAP